MGGGVKFNIGARKRPMIIEDVTLSIEAYDTIAAFGIGAM